MTIELPKKQPLQPQPKNSKAKKRSMVNGLPKSIKFDKNTAQTEINKPIVLINADA